MLFNNVVLILIKKKIFLKTLFPLLNVQHNRISVVEHSFSMTLTHSITLTHALYPTHSLYLTHFLPLSLTLCLFQIKCTRCCNTTARVGVRSGFLYFFIPVVVLVLLSSYIWVSLVVVLS